jgi:foldase protein PrsA
MLDRHRPLSLPRRPRKPVLLTLTAGLLAALAFAGCGNDVPPGAVANVDGTVIEKSEFDRWLVAAARSQQQQAGAPGGPVSIPDPPDYRKCAAARVKQPQQSGATKLNEQQARTLCKQEYDLLRDQVMQFLISSEWIEKEAESRGIEATDAEVDRMFDQQKRQSFQNEGQYQEFLRASGQTEADLKFRIRLDVLSNKVREEIVKDKGEVTDSQVRDYYNKNKSQFGEPEKRDLSVVLTQKEAEAAKAKRALEDGQSFREVAKRYSIDEASKGQGGKLPGVTRGQQDAAFDQAVFKAKKGELVGPVKTQFGFYVFRVDKITPGSQQSFEQSRETIKAQLRSEKEQKALDAFVKEFQKEYRDKTNCAKGYAISQCKNGPKEQPQMPGAGQGAPPQGGQGAPPQGAPPVQGNPPSGG